MRTRQMAITGLILAALMGGAAAAPAENWVGAWGYTAMPPPPGYVAPTVAGAATLATAVPLGLAPAAAAARGGAGNTPLLDNPGNVQTARAPADLANVTLRQLVRVTVAGKRIRLRLSNEGNTQVRLLGAVHVGLAGPDGAVVAGSDHVVTFDGQGAVTLPADAPLVSDPVALAVQPLDRLLISLYVPGAVTRGHSLYQYVATGDATAQAQLPDPRLMNVAALVTEVDVDAQPGAASLVAYGDSITEGFGSTANAFRGWPDRLGERLAAAGARWGVVDAGIGGNRLLRYGTGPSALARLDRDALSVPGVKAIILLEGINDIGHNVTEPVTAEALEAADRQIIDRAHAKGIRVIGATLTPYEGAPYYDAKGEVIREALNAWILTSGAFDGVVDFAGATADPAHPTVIRGDFNLRDKLHPNDAGYAALGAAIDLKLLEGK